MQRPAPVVVKGKGAMGAASRTPCAQAPRWQGSASFACTVPGAAPSYRVSGSDLFVEKVSGCPSSQGGDRL